MSQPEVPITSTTIPRVPDGQRPHDGDRPQSKGKTEGLYPLQYVHANRV